MLKILDCTLRDGGYINNWRFNNNFINSLCEVSDKNNINYIEIGFINKTNKYKNSIVGSNRLLTNDIINNFNKYNFKTVVMADYLDINLDLLYKNIKVDLIRIAFHKTDLINALDTCKLVKDLGYKVSVNAMAITNYNEDELDYLFNFINKHNLDILYIADSYGSLHQNDIKYYLNLYNKKLNTASIGFHLHNNMNNAYSNYEYIKNISNDINREIIIDTTMFGMGRGSGNLQTELVLIDKKNIDLNKFIKLLEFIQDFIKPIYLKNENKWGYDLDYLLSGYFKMHPNYIIKMRDLNISMKNRFFLIKKITEKKYKYNYFDKNIIENIIIEFMEKLL